MKKEILKLLSEKKEYVSGQEICERLSVSRTAIWKAINGLREEGYKIESVPSRGYLLVESPDRMTAEELGSRLTGCIFEKNIIYKEETDSTSIEAKRQAEAGAVHGTVVVSEYQLQGRGRRGKSWSSPKGTGIWMSLLLRPGINPQKAACLTLLAALAASRAIEAVTGMKAEIKWPNDLVIQGKKICGILTEMSSEMDFIHYVVIGIGINVNMEEFPESLPFATSLKIESGQSWHRAELAAAVLREFSGCYESFIETGNLKRFLSEYNDRLVNCNRPVQVIKQKGILQGIARGINPEGELLVETKEGLEAVLSGEVSVRGVYGYV